MNKPNITGEGRAPLWNWELSDWPNFTCDASQLAELEAEFLKEVGGALAVLKHLDSEERRQFSVEILAIEGYKSSEIEGEILQRDSLQSSIKRHFGLGDDHLHVRPKEQGVGDLMWDVYDTFDQPLSEDTLNRWHLMLMGSSNEVEQKGEYRSHSEPMQIVSSSYENRHVYFQAPPSSRIPDEMRDYIDWFNALDPRAPMLTNAALLHLYFESIHPYEDGNGRIGRALVGKYLSQCFGQPALIATSHIIYNRRKEYYAALSECNRSLEATAWVRFFGEVIVQAQKESLRLIHFLMHKSQLMSKLVAQINPRQKKVLLRMFAEGPDGFSGGLSSENYQAITKTSRATATRDLADLLEKGALTRTGQRRHTRYWLQVHLSGVSGHE